MQTTDSPVAINAERALARLEQLAREEQAAVDAADVDAICRISELLPEATAFVLKSVYNPETRLRERVAAIQETHRAAEEFLGARLAETREALRNLGGGRRTMHGYGRSQQCGAIRAEG
jgi:hypothetical protein